MKIFSYIINFVRFRESQTSVIDTHFNAVESTKSRIENLYVSKSDLASHLQALRSQRSSQEAATREKTARNNALKERLLELKKAQEKVALDMERVKKVKSELAGQLHEKTEATLAVKREVERLSPYASQSSAELQGQLNELSTSLARDKAAADAQARRHRALQTSCTSFAAAGHDVVPLISLLKSTVADIADEHAEDAEAAKRREVLAEKSADVKEIQRTEALLARQLQGWVERTKGLRKNEAERGARAAERMRELKGEYEILGRERGERGREVERRRVRVEQTEKKVSIRLSFGFL